jgi:hypothetical protein
VTWIILAAAGGLVVGAVGGTLWGRKVLESFAMALIGEKPKAKGGKRG